MAVSLYPNDLGRLMLLNDDSEQQRGGGRLSEGEMANWLAETRARRRWTWCLQALYQVARRGTYIALTKIQ